MKGIMIAGLLTLVSGQSFAEITNQRAIKENAINLEWMAKTAGIMVESFMVPLSVVKEEIDYQDFLKSYLEPLCKVSSLPSTSDEKSRHPQINTAYLQMKSSHEGWLKVNFEKINLNRDQMNILVQNVVDKLVEEFNCSSLSSLKQRFNNTEISVKNIGLHGDLVLGLGFGKGTRKYQSAQSPFYFTYTLKEPYFGLYLGASAGFAGYDAMEEKIRTKEIPLHPEHHSLTVEELQIKWWRECESAVKPSAFINLVPMEIGTEGINMAFKFYGLALGAKLERRGKFSATQDVEAFYRLLGVRYAPWETSTGT